MSDELKKQIVDFITERTAKGKGLNTMRDIAKTMSDASRKDIRDAISNMIDNNELKYWSSGSTTYITLPNFSPGSGETAEE
ncbi:MAG: hypothetical protein JXQ73_14425 [Phycisphaerae bacterium]|nr:hypothetical protein [Phycisphaerae bacterium]